ncbi:PPE domain-containing protein [Mycolicibacter heraklionensis]|uniref:PPE domain-containing protein n=1 Tax=Mycolicibacter heraklionensis TaxID=512402 RepID=UPI000B1D39E0|nr:PPE domain-containing protein [Mycolicibacter heraklionensis]
MFGPVWMASPPEVHATLLSAGPGPGPLLAAAGAWSSLSVAYTTAAQDLSALLGSVAAGLWSGVAAEQYQAAHLPYLAWLYRAAADSARMAAVHDQAAGAYTAALAAMPTWAELAANHATHGVLVATNFFGINTIPIAVNEADYFRMWVQAATVMAAYQAACEASAAAIPTVTPAAPIQRSAEASSPWSSQRITENPLQGLLDFLEPYLKSLGLEDGVGGFDRVTNGVTTVVADFLRNFGINWDPAAGTINGFEYELYADATRPIWYLARTLELYQDFLAITQDPTQIIPALQYFAALVLFDWPTHIAQLLQAVSQPAAMAAAAGAVVAPVGGLAGLAGLPQPVPAGGAVPVGPVTPAVVADVPAVAVGSAVAAAPPPPAAPPAAAPAGAAPVPPAAAPPATVPAAPPLFPYVVGGGPRIDYGSGLGAHASAADSAKRKTPTPESASAAAAAESRRAKRLRRRQTRTRHGDAVMDLTVGVTPDCEPAPVSDHGAGELGRSGSGQGAGSRATGLTRLEGAEFADGPRVPLLPDGWDLNRGGG